MDNSLTPIESEWLERHISICEKCREDFVAYEVLLEALSSEAEIEAPDDLEIRVMEQIKSMPMPSDFKAKGKDRERTVVATSVGLVLSLILGSIIFFGIDRVGEAISYSRFAAYTAFLGGIADNSIALLGSASIALGELAMSASIIFDRYSYVLLFVVTILIFLQMALWKKDRVSKTIA